MNGRKVYQYDLKGNFVKEHENGNSASFMICNRNENRTDIYKALKSKTNYCKGFLWTTTFYMKYPII
jgi:hypothetical protein